MSDFQIQRICCIALANLAEEAENHPLLVDGDMIPMFMMALTTTHKSQKETNSVKSFDMSYLFFFLSF